MIWLGVGETADYKGRRRSGPALLQQGQFFNWEIIATHQFFSAHDGRSSAHRIPWRTPVGRHPVMTTREQEEAAEASRIAA
jgi:hypothetical protein